VAWINEGECGLTFEKPISHEVVLELTGRHDETTTFRVDPARIPLGRRRHARQLATREEKT